MRYIITSLFILAFTLSFAQTSKTRSLLRSIEGEWKTDDKGNVVYVQIVEAAELSKEEIYTRALDYFTYNYNNGKSVIQTKDPEKGRILAKGIYQNVHSAYEVFLVTKVSTHHIVQVDIKEGRARIIITLNQMDHVSTDSEGESIYHAYAMSECYPVNPRGRSKTVGGKAFYKSHVQVLHTFDKLEKAIKEGNTDQTIAGDDW
ncbi:MAG: DUF4468 domain-containing protein [Bacteroidota bacterium]